MVFGRSEQLRGVFLLLHAAEKGKCGMNDRRRGLKTDDNYRFQGDLNMKYTAPTMHRPAYTKSSFMLCFMNRIENGIKMASVITS